MADDSEVKRDRYTSHNNENPAQTRSPLNISKKKDLLTLKKLFVARAVGVNFAGKAEDDRNLNSPRARESRRSEFPVSTNSTTKLSMHEQVQRDAFSVDTFIHSVTRLAVSVRGAYHRGELNFPTLVGQPGVPRLDRQESGEVDIRSRILSHYDENTFSIQPNKYGSGHPIKSHDHIR